MGERPSLAYFLSTCGCTTGHKHPHAFRSLLAHAAKIQNDLRILTERLARINDNLARKVASRNECVLAPFSLSPLHSRKLLGCEEEVHTCCTHDGSLHSLGAALALYSNETSRLIRFVVLGMTRPFRRPRPRMPRSWSRHRLCCTCSRGRASTLPRSAKRHLNRHTRNGAVHVMSKKKAVGHPAAFEKGRDCPSLKARGLSASACRVCYDGFLALHRMHDTCSLLPLGYATVATASMRV